MKRSGAGSETGLTQKKTMLNLSFCASPVFDRHFYEKTVVFSLRCNYNLYIRHLKIVRKV